MITFKRILALALMCLTLMGALPFSALAMESENENISVAAAQGKGTYVITTESLRVRSGPGTSYTKIGNLSSGDKVTVTEVSGSWGKISFNGTTGWISLDYAALITDSGSTVATKQFTLSEAGLQMIKNFEGYRQYRYWDGGHYSIGYGSTCGANDYPNGISEAEASALLVSRMATYEAGLDKFLYNNGIKVTQPQYDALVSFTYNFGNPWTRWDEFTLKTILINGAFKYTEDQIISAFCEFVKSGGVVVQGLVSRRTKEAKMFISGTVFYQSGSFKDVYTRDWYYNAVEFVNQKGIMTGVTGGKFDPSSSLTRAMMVTTLAKMGGVRIDPYKGTSSFADVKADTWYAPYVQWAYKVGITKGIGNGNFGPDKTITRQDMIAMLYKFADVAGYNVSFTDKGTFAKFTDHGKVSAYAVEAMKWAVERGCISGTSDNRLLPLNKATRAETAQIMKNYYEKGRVW